MVRLREFHRNVDSRLTRCFRTMSSETRGCVVILYRTKYIFLRANRIAQLRFVILPTKSLDDVLNMNRVILNLREQPVEVQSDGPHRSQLEIVRVSDVVGS